MAGALPVCAEIDESFNLDAEDLERHITPQNAPNPSHLTKAGRSGCANRRGFQSRDQLAPYCPQTLFQRLLCSIGGRNLSSDGPIGGARFRTDLDASPGRSLSNPPIRALTN